MRSVPTLVSLALLAVACSKPPAVTEPLILELPAAAASGEAAAADAGAAATPRMDSGRDCEQERESFERLARSGRADPDEIREALGVGPDFRFQYETLAGDAMAGAEYRLRGPRSGAPFFEALADEHEGESYYVFFERGWFQTRAVDCGFQRAGMYGAQFADG